MRARVPSPFPRFAPTGPLGREFPLHFSINILVAGQKVLSFPPPPDVRIEDYPRLLFPPNSGSENHPSCTRPGTGTPSKTPLAPFLVGPPQEVTLCFSTYAGSLLREISQNETHHAAGPSSPMNFQILPPPSSRPSPKRLRESSSRRRNRGRAGFHLFPLMRSSALSRSRPAFLKCR